MTDELSEKDWRHFPSEEKATFFDWGAFEPNNGRDANCAAFVPFYFLKWADEPCTAAYNSVCEKRRVLYHSLTTNFAQYIDTF
jgi:hypothetical protein